MNKTDQTLYVVNDDSEREMLDVSSGETRLRLTPPNTLLCGSSTAPLHAARFLFFVAPGTTRAAAVRWEEVTFAIAGKRCVECARQGRPDLGVELVDQYSSVGVSPGTYKATVKVLGALPAGCVPAANGFHCAGWPGAAVLANQIRSTQVDVTIAADTPPGSDQHVSASF